MPKGFNPFQEWLSIETPGRPTHYQLLGIEATESDTKEIQIAAQKQLAKLNKVDPGSREKTLQTLRQEVKKAYSVISKPDLRAQYDQALAAALLKAQEEERDLLPPTKSPKKIPDSKADKSNPISDSIESSTAPLAENIVTGEQTSVPVAEPSVVPAQANPAQANPAQAIPAQAIPAQAIPLKDNPPQAIPVQSQPAAIPVAAPASDPETIPNALPVAKSISESPPAQIPPAVPAAQIAESKEDQDLISASKNPSSVIQADAQTQDDGQLDLGVKSASTKVKRRTKKSIATPIFGTILAIAAIGGLVMVVNHFSGGIIIGAAGEADKSDETKSDQADGRPNDQSNKSDGVMGPTEKGEVDNTPLGTRPPKTDDPRKDDPRKDDPETNETDGTGKRPNPFDDESKDPFGPDPNSETGNSNGGEDMENGDSSEQMDEELSFEEVLSAFKGSELRDLLAFNHTMNLIENQWRRCPSFLFQNDKSSLELQSYSVAGKQAGRIEEAIEETTERLSEFWIHLRKSAIETMGGALSADGKTVGFVDAGQQGVVLKIAGTNREYEYQFMPPALIPVIADQGTIDDIPTYRMQKAAFLIANLKRNPSLKRQILALLALSESDGHDVSNLRMMTELDYWNFSSTDSKVKIMSLSDSIESMEEQFDFTYGRKLKNLNRADAARKYREVLAHSIDQDETSLRAAALESARVLSAQSGQVLVCLDITNELISISDANADLHRLNSFERLSETVADDLENSKAFCEQVLWFLRNDPRIRQSDAIRICNDAIQIAENRSLSSARIQLNAKLDEIRQ